MLCLIYSLVPSLGSNNEKPDYETIPCSDLFDDNQMADWSAVALLFITDILLFFVFHISMRQSHHNSSLFYRIDFVVPCNLLHGLLGFKRWETGLWKIPCSDLFDCNRLIGSCITFYERHFVVFVFHIIMRQSHSIACILLL